MNLESPRSLPRKAGTCGKLPSEAPLYPDILYHVHGSFSNTTIVGRILGGTERTQNNTEQVSVMVALTTAVHRDTESRKAPAVVSWSQGLVTFGAELPLSDTISAKFSHAQ